MCRMINKVGFWFVLATGLASPSAQQLRAHTCPTDASDTGVAVLMSAFRINPDGTTGPAVVGPIGICECIRLRMLIRYTTPGPSGRKVAFFEAGTMTVRTASVSFIDDGAPTV